MSPEIAQSLLLSIVFAVSSSRLTGPEKLKESHPTRTNRQTNKPVSSRSILPDAGLFLCLVATHSLSCNDCFVLLPKCRSYLERLSCYQFLSSCLLRPTKVS